MYFIWSNLEPALNFLVSTALARLISLTGTGRAAEVCSGLFLPFFFGKLLKLLSLPPGLEQELPSLPGRAELLPEALDTRTWVAGLEQPHVMTCGNLCIEFRVPDSKYLHQWPLLWPLFLWRALDLQKGVGFTDFKWKQRSVYLQGSQRTNKQVLFLWAELSKE